MKGKVQGKEKEKVRGDVSFETCYNVRGNTILCSYFASYDDCGFFLESKILHTLLEKKGAT